MTEELPCNRGNARVTPLPPSPHPLSNNVDEIQGNELFLEHGELGTPGSRPEIVARRPPPLYQYRLPFSIVPIAGGFFKRRIDDGIVNEDRHSIFRYTPV